MLTCMYQAICTCRQTLIKGVLNQGQSPQRTPLLYAHMYVSSYMHVQANANQGCTEPGAEPPTYTLAICSHESSYMHVQANANQGCTEPGAEPPTYTLDYMATCNRRKQKYKLLHMHTYTMSCSATYIVC